MSVLHDDIIKSIQCDHAPEIGRQLIESYIFPNTNPSICIYETPEMISSGQKVYPDLVAIINTGVGIHMTAIIEVKRTLNDLYHASAQYSKYLGHSTCFFIALPNQNIGDGICMIHTMRIFRSYAGIIDATHGDIVVLPKLQNFPIENEVELLSKMYHTPRFMTEASGKYRYRDIPHIPYQMEYTEIDGICVRNKYADIALSRAKTGDHIKNMYK